MPVVRGWVVVLMALAMSLEAQAHSVFDGDQQERLAATLSGVVLLAFWMSYAWGCRLRRASPWRQACFHLTAVLAMAALLGPLDEWAKTSSTAHMVQHMTLMVVIAPLWVIARPLPQLAAATGRAGAALWRPMLRLTRHPLTVTYLHAAVIWAWHMPLFYMLAVRNPWWHVIEHACFLVSAGVFWWVILRSSGRQLPRAFLALLLTLMHTGFLGAILTFARTPLYGEARDLADQQLAGLVMWVLGAVPYLIASTWLGARWFVEIQRRTNDADAVRGSPRLPDSRSMCETVHSSPAADVKLR
jgi:putative membrane protein